MVAPLSNPTAPNPSKLMAQLRMMPDQQLVQYAQMHKNDPYIFPMAFQESNTRKQMRAAQYPQAAQAPKVVDQNLQEMAQPMPEDQGIATLPAPNMERLAGGGIVAFDDGGQVPGYADSVEVPGYKTGGTPGDDVFERAFKKVLKLEGGSKYLKDDAGRGPTKYGINQTANPDVDIKNLTEDQAREIYRKRYWNTIGGDALAAKNPQLAIIAFDASVNQGPGTAKQMIAQAGDSPYELLKLRQERYIDLATPKDTDTPEQAARRKIHKSNLGGWTNRISSLQKDFEQDRNKQGLPALTPGAQAMAATGPEAAQPDLDKDKASAITTGLATLFGGAGAAGAGMNMGPLNEVLRPSTRLGIAAPGAVLPAAVGATGAALSTGAANALSNATPEQLDQLSTDIGSDTGIAAAIMNAPNRPPEKPPMPYGEQMANIAKTVVSAPDRPRKPEVAPEPVPETPKGGMPDLNQAFRQFELGQQNKVEGVQVAKPEITPEAIAAAPKDPLTGGTDWNKLMLQMGLQLMSGKSPNMLTNIGEAGLGTLAMQQAEEKAKSERESKMSEAEYRKAVAGQARAETAAIERGAKEKNMQLEAEKLVQQHMEKWNTGVGKFATMSDKSAPLAEELRVRQEIYRQLGIKPIMAAGAPTGGAKFIGFENPA